MIRRIYYTDGSFYEGPVDNAPTEGVQFVAEFRPEVTFDPDTGIGQKAVYMGGNWYDFDNDVCKPRAMQRNSVLEGKLMPDADFEKLKQKVFAWLLLQ